MPAFFLPRISLGKLVLSGFVLAILPLLITIASTIHAVDDLAASSQKTVYEVAQLSQKSQLLRQRIGDFERRGRQSLVLTDADMRHAFTSAHEQVQKLVQELRVGTGDAAVRQQLDRLAASEEEAYREVLAEQDRGPTNRNPATKHGDGSSETARLDALFQNLGAQASALSDAYAALVDREVEQLHVHSSAMQKRILLHSSILLPAAALVVTFFTVVITRPIRQLEESVRKLGTGDYLRPIQVRGPADIRFLGERLEWLRNRLHALEEARQQFMRHVSHEIKTPIASIHEGAGLLLDEVVGELNPEQKEIAQILASNTRRLDQLITALIHFSQANANPAGLRREVVDMRALVREVVEQYRVRLRANSIGLKAELQPVSIYGNREQLRTVIDNLLSNAVKYSPTGEIIRVALTTENEHMVFEVEDRGPGIDHEEREKVFEPFYQGRNSRELGVQGTGLGLAIVRECVASHQGWVELVDPPTARGTLARVRIPLRSEGRQRLRVRIALPAEGKET